MREIKFKVKIKGDAKLWEVYVIDFLHLQVLRNVSGSYEMVSFDKIEAFLQFTGLLDRNGREVWEGDILLTDEGGWIAQVDFVRGCFVLQNHTVKMGGFSVEPNWEECEVIGTVWENPELLEDK